MDKRGQSGLYASIILVVIALIIVLIMLFFVFYWQFFGIEENFIGHNEKPKQSYGDYESTPTCRSVPVAYTDEVELEYDSYRSSTYDCNRHWYGRHNVDEEEDEDTGRCFDVEVHNSDDTGGIFEVDCGSGAVRDSWEEYIGPGESVSFTCVQEARERYHDRYYDFSYSVNAPTKTETKYVYEVHCN